MYVDKHGKPAPLWRVAMMYGAYCFMGLAMVWAAGDWYVNDLRDIDIDDGDGITMMVPLLVAVAVLLRVQTWSLRKAKADVATRAAPRLGSD